MKRIDAENQNLRHLLQEKELLLSLLLTLLLSHVSQDDFRSVGQNIHSVVTMCSVHEQNLTAPSDYAKQHHQKDGHVIDHRNIAGEPSSHISLQCRLFGEFRDKLSANPEPKYLEYAMQCMSCYYRNELDHQSAFFIQ